MKQRGFVGGRDRIEGACDLRPCMIFFSECQKGSDGFSSEGKGMFARRGGGAG